MPKKTKTSNLRLSMPRILFHVLFWGAISLLYVISYSRLDKGNAWIMVTKDMFAVITIFYFMAYMIIPKWLTKGKYAYSFLWLILIYVWWCTITYFTCWILNTYMEPNSRLQSLVDLTLKYGVLGMLNVTNRSFYFLDFIYLTALPLGLKVMQSFVRVRYQKTELERDKLELERDNLELELAFLKSQLNPHFLFNTLNNIYILITEGSPVAAASIEKLSGIMQYLLHESNRTRVTLQTELDFLRDYLELERLRFDKDMPITVDLKTDDEDYPLVPLILFPFIENAFKHGPKTSTRNAWVCISIQAKDGVLNVLVANGKSDRAKPMNYVGGIGTANVKKRLELNYQGNYRLDIEDTDGQYAMKLEITLDQVKVS